MKVAILSGSCYSAPPKSYGSECESFYLARDLAAQGHEVHLFGPGGSRHPGAGGFIHYHRGSYGVPDLDADADPFTWYGDVLRSCDIVHDLSPTLRTVEELYLERPDFPYLYTRNGIDFNRPRFGRRNAVVLSQAARHCALTGTSAWAGTPYEGTALDSVAGSVPWAEVVPYGIPVDEGDEFGYWPGGGSEGYLLYVGRPHPAKGVGRIIELARRMPGRRFVLAWRPASADHAHYDAAYREQAAGLDNVHFVTLPAVGQMAVKRVLYQHAAAMVTLPVYCLPAGQHVVTETGGKDISTVQVGERVMSHAGIYQSVTEKFERAYSGPLTVLKVAGGLPLRLTPNHRVFAVKTKACSKVSVDRCHPGLNLSRCVACPGSSERPEQYARVLELVGAGVTSAAAGRAVGVSESTAYHWATGRSQPTGIGMPYWKDYAPAWVPAAELTAGDFVVEPLPRTVKRATVTVGDYIEVFPQDDVVIGRGWQPGRYAGAGLPPQLVLTPAFLRLCGYWLAEGCEQRGLKFDFHKDETDYIADVLAGLAEVGVRGTTKDRPGQSVTRISGSNALLGSLFCAWFGRGAARKSLPAWVMELEPAQALHLLVAYWRGDGCLTKRNGYEVAQFRTVSPMLAQQVATLLWKCGFHPSVSAGRQSVKSFGSGRPTYSVTLSGGQVERFCEAAGISVEVRPRPQEWSLGFVRGGAVWHPIREVDAGPFEGTVYNLEVEEDHSYVANGVACHNCEAFGLTTIEALACGTPVIATDKGAAPEILLPGRTGFLVPPEEDEFEVLERAVRGIPELSREFCRQDAEARWSVRRMAGDYLRLYARVAAGDLLAPADRFAWQRECVARTTGLVLNVGCKDDAAGLRATHGPRVVNLDRNDFDEDALRNEGRRVPIPVDVRHDMLRFPWPFPDGMFEMAVFGDVLEDLPQNLPDSRAFLTHPAVLREARRVARRLCITCPTDTPERDWHHLTTIDEARLRGWLEHTGWRVVEWRRVTYALDHDRVMLPGNFVLAEVAE